jgi:hypothetical protein
VRLTKRTFGQLVLAVVKLCLAILLVVMLLVMLLLSPLADLTMRMRSKPKPITYRPTPPRIAGSKEGL